MELFYENSMDEMKVSEVKPNRVYVVYFDDDWQRVQTVALQGNQVRTELFEVVLWNCLKYIKRTQVGLIVGEYF
jgi:predicted neutral ceramidase superfamily lipid hydrolase